MPQGSSIKVFDEYVSAGSGMVYTSDRWNQLMGSFDEITLHAVIDNVSANATGSFDCWVQVSGDNRLWLQRNDTSQTYPPPGTAATGDLSIPVLYNTIANSTLYSDACLGITMAGSPGSAAGPLLAFVRLAVHLGTVGAHVCIYYSGRGHLG